MEAALNAPHFNNAEKAREYLEKLRWANGITCPHCGTIGEHYKLEGKAHRKGVYKCKDCREQFTVTVGTVFESSRVPLHKWLLAVHLMCSSKKGMSAKQIERLLGITYKTAWFMCDRIREAMNGNGNTGKLGKRGGVVEVDETYWGNSGKQRKGARGAAHKEKIVSLVERNGRVRSYHVQTVTAATLKPILREQISKQAHIMTDEFRSYRGLEADFASHETVTHSIGEYVRGKAHSNTVEGYFSLLKRGLIGTFHHVGPQHLQRYVAEFDFRYNYRKTNDEERAANALLGIAGKRLMYRDSRKRETNE